MLCLVLVLFVAAVCFLFLLKFLIINYKTKTPVHMIRVRVLTKKKMRVKSDCSSLVVFLITRCCTMAHNFVFRAFPSGRSPGNKVDWHTDYCS